MKRALQNFCRYDLAQKLTITSLNSPISDISQFTVMRFEWSLLTTRLTMIATEILQCHSLELLRDDKAAKNTHTPI